MISVYLLLDWGVEVLSKRHFMLSPCKSRMRDELYWGEAL